MDVRESRRAKRESYSARTHFGELDDDADRFEAVVARLDGRISRLMIVGVGVLVSLTTSSLLLLLNLIAPK